MTHTLAEEIASSAEDQDCRCLVLRGSNGHFAAGRDLSDVSSDTPFETVLENDDAWAAIFDTLSGMNKPSLAAVEGYAVAGGFTLAMGCDFVIAEQSSKFGALEMRGGFPAALNTAVLSRLIGPRFSLELLLSTDLFDAPYLHQMGLINHLADGSKNLESIVRSKATSLAALDPLAVKLTKETHRAVSSLPLREGLTVGKHLNALLLCGGRFDVAKQLHDNRIKSR
tara:strand:+ start:878 stop:1555 length:678 start_codon:yes stop_codon:yes gene_type:complete